MADTAGDRDAVEAIALLAEPRRRSLYDLVAASGEPVGRDDAAAALGISRELAAFHLDRLVDAGLLRAEYRRRSGRTGPGAGRPAKLYRRAEREVTASFPVRHYDRAGDLMAMALEGLADGSGREALAAAAVDAGRALGRTARAETDEPAGAPATGSVADLVAVLDRAGYEPRLDPTGTLRLENCPYRVLATAHRDLTCGMNLAWATGVVDGLGQQGVDVELAPEPGRCCVVFRGEGARADNGPGGEAGTDVGRSPT